MTNKPKAIGTRTEVGVVRVLVESGHTEALRVVLHGAADEGDVHYATLSGAKVCVEVKGGKAAEQASDEQVEAWLLEAERERQNTGAAYALLVTKRAGYGHLRAASWRAHLLVRPTPNGLRMRAPMVDMGAGPSVRITCTLADAIHILDAVSGPVMRGA